MSDKVAIAISAHPDDIEFYNAGTMLLLSGQRCRYDVPNRMIMRIQKVGYCEHGF
jgi:hypothetical protein